MFKMSFSSKSDLKKSVRISYSESSLRLLLGVMRHSGGETVVPQYMNVPSASELCA